MFPFSFQEYCQYYDDISDKDKLFDEYAIKGGLAGSYAYRTEKDRTNYIKEVYETIVMICSPYGRQWKYPKIYHMRSIFLCLGNSIVRS